MKDRLVFRNLLSFISQASFSLFQVVCRPASHFSNFFCWKKPAVITVTLIHWNILSPLCCPVFEEFIHGLESTLPSLMWLVSLSSCEFLPQSIDGRRYTRINWNSLENRMIFHQCVFYLNNENTEHLKNSFILPILCWTNLRNSNPALHKLALKYQRSSRRLQKAELDLKFSPKCKELQVYPKFVRWKSINKKKKRTQKRYHHLLLQDAITEKKTNISFLKSKTNNLKTEICSKAAWMRAKLICISVERLLHKEKSKILRRHSKKFQHLLDMKTTADDLQSNPSDVILNLSGQDLSKEQVDIFKLGLRQCLATRIQRQPTVWRNIR